MDKVEFTEEEEFEQLQKARNGLVWVSIFSMVMLFAGFTSAYLVSSASNFWVVMDLPSAFWISSLIIVLSSIPMVVALRAAREGKQTLLTAMLGLTLVMGVGFTYTQFQGYGQLVATGNHFTGSKIGMVTGEYGVDYVVQKGEHTLVLEDGIFFMPNDRARSRPMNDQLDNAANTASSYIYVLTAVHIIHLLGGLIMLIILLINATRGRYIKGKWHVIRRGGIYWHFLGALWVYLFLFLQYIH